MPSVASHFVCSKLISEYLNIDDDEFHIGNILPDIIGNENSHFKKKGQFYLIPNIEKFTQEFEISNNLELGYLCHLLLDKYFLEEYIPNHIHNYQEMDIFKPEIIYNDYTNMNFRLILDFDLNVNYINNLLMSLKIPVQKNKLLINIKNLNNKVIDENLKVLNYEEYRMFLNEVSKRIALELKKYKKGKIL